MSLGGVSATLTAVLSSYESQWMRGGRMADRDKVVPLRIVEGGLKPEHRCVLVCHCGSSSYELAGTGRGDGGKVRCARCRCIKEIAWHFTGDQPEPV